LIIEGDHCKKKTTIPGCGHYVRGADVLTKLKERMDNKFCVLSIRFRQVNFPPRKWQINAGMYISGVVNV
jgi:hypothetical protein